MGACQDYYRNTSHEFLRLDRGMYMFSEMKAKKALLH